MTFTGFSLSKGDFDQIPWQAIPDSCSKRECGEYAQAFASKASEAETKGDKKAQQAYMLLGGLVSMRMVLDSIDQPFNPALVFQNARTADIDDFTDDQLALISQLVPETRDAELQARMADILWIRTKNYLMAEQAIASYLDAASIFEKGTHWASSFDRLERALQL